MENVFVFLYLHIGVTEVDGAEWPLWHQLNDVYGVLS